MSTAWPCFSWYSRCWLRPGGGRDGRARFSAGPRLVKLYPAVLVVGLVGTRTRRWSALLRAAIGAGAVAAAGYFFHVLDAGARVLGYLPGYLREEQYDEGGRYLLAGLLGLPGGVTATLAALGALAVVAWVLWRRPAAPEAFALLLGAFLLAATPVQPWYAVTLLAVATVAAQPRWALVVAAAYPYYFAVILGAPHAVAIGRVSYGLALAGVVALFWLRTRRPAVHDGGRGPFVGGRDRRAPDADRCGGFGPARCSE